MPETSTADIAHRTIDANGIRIHVAEAGEGPLVLLLHGFPEGWYSWRHQIRALSAAGYHAVAPDLRGFGDTDRPEEVRRYSMLHVVGDIVHLIYALGESRAVVIGHDWGATVAWNMSLLRPDMLRGVGSLASTRRAWSPTPPLEAGRNTYGPGYYQIYYQTPGVAEREFEENVGKTMRAFLCGESGQAKKVYDMTVTDHGMLPKFEIFDELPAWLTEHDIEHWETVYRRTGFTGGLNWYRNVTTNWELMAPWAGSTVTVPALCMMGEMDHLYQWRRNPDWTIPMRETVPELEAILLEGCGHWMQQEKPHDVNEALVQFVSRL